MNIKRFVLASVLLAAMCLAAGCSCSCKSKNACDVPDKTARSTAASEVAVP